MKAHLKIFLLFFALQSVVQSHSHYPALQARFKPDRYSLLARAPPTGGTHGSTHGGGSSHGTSHSPAPAQGTEPQHTTQGADGGDEDTPEDIAEEEYIRNEASVPELTEQEVDDLLRRAAAIKARVKAELQGGGASSSKTTPSKKDPSAHHRRALDYEELTETLYRRAPTAPEAAPSYDDMVAYMSGRTGGRPANLPTIDATKLMFWSGVKQSVAKKYAQAHGLYIMQDVKAGAPGRGYRKWTSARKPKTRADTEPVWANLDEAFASLAENEVTVMMTEKAKTRAHSHFWSYEYPVLKRAGITMHFINSGGNPINPPPTTPNPGSPMKGVEATGPGSTGAGTSSSSGKNQTKGGKKGTSKRDVDILAAFESIVLRRMLAEDFHERGLSKGDLFERDLAQEIVYRRDLYERDPDEEVLHGRDPYEGDLYERDLYERGFLEEELSERDSDEDE